MFGLSFFELIAIFGVALLVFGPDKLPEIAKTLGKLSAELRKTSDNVRREFYNSMYPPATEIKTSPRELTTEKINKEDPNNLNASKMPLKPEETVKKLED
jgi:sec-independent protein translocase protein TatB